jgi:hypothetical protein
MRCLAVLAALAGLGWSMVAAAPAEAQTTRTASCRIPTFDLSSDSLRRVMVHVRRDGSCRVTLTGEAPAAPATATAPPPASATAPSAPRMITFEVMVDTPPPQRRRLTQRMAQAPASRPQVVGRVQPIVEPRPPGPACFVFNGRRYCE